MTQDNDGKVWFQGGASGMPGYFQFPVHYGNFAPPDQFEPDLNIVWGAPILIGDIQAGLPGTRMPDGSLIYATAAAGNEIYRGDRLPKDLIGDYLYGEVVARIVRRLQAGQDRRPHAASERLSALRVHPIARSAVPSGRHRRPARTARSTSRTCIAASSKARSGRRRARICARRSSSTSWTRSTGHGRVWRLTYDGIARDRTQPRMLNETPAQLVAHLSHPNGWWRDTAQQLLVLKQDKSVVPALQTLVRTSKNPLARVPRAVDARGTGRAQRRAHARGCLRDPDPRMRIQALRASETLYKAGDRSFAADYRALAKDKDVDVVIQAMLTMNVLKVADASTTVKAAMDGNKARGVQFVADRILNPPAAAGAAAAAAVAPLTPEQQSSLERGGAIYTELCLLVPRRRRARHADARSGAPGSTLAPSLAGSARVNGHRDYVIKTLLHGLSGPMDGKVVSAGHGGDGLEQGPVDRRRRLVRAQQLRQHRHVRDAGGRRAGPRRHRRSEGAVDGRGAGRVAAAAARAGRRRGRSRPATTRDRRRRRTPKAATTSSATPPARSTSWAGRPACRSKPACGSRSSCPRR